MVLVFLPTLATGDHAAPPRAGLVHGSIGTRLDKSAIIHDCNLGSSMQVTRGYEGSPSEDREGLSEELRGAE